MDAHAHLLSLGWAGPGHSLDSRPYKQKGHRGLAYDPAKVGNNGVGLVKPLSISQRKGRFGVGKKAHEPPAGNQWWLKGFENALGNIGKSESERSSGTATPITHDSGGTGKHGGLYTFFVKGQEMEGTIGKVGDVKRTSKKRKSGALDDREQDGAMVSKKQEAAAEFEEAGAYFALRDKDEKRYQRLQKQNPVAEFEQVGEYLQAGLGKKPKKRKSQVEPEDTELATLDDLDNDRRSPPSQGETKEERRERRRLRKEKKERQRNALADLENRQQLALPNDAVTEDIGEKADGRAERKRRKSAKSTKSLRGG
ncbi:uncharacterized protein Z520_02116 [Fonsecaea multimorphosa CBS 102226]|uniref:G-patch domain-containing protein n=1 Tax=Fonsecaea multimorphosa CBS 102226 TaxID=1442371 RepID=A0A0D2K7J8_9EURO|nr:uncharacterized protein Z520_02116 [Fonsecaea multimorphosa CBS 102226]KIY01978.1 hypothetical protein Z520_02116 [Fonsecaea multimorphosa CBS 102226]OAL29660.1 hypothetical protein AYO22_02074 [Fonsecaea multimorphosa]